jgi:hypothetical protein
LAGAFYLSRRQALKDGEKFWSPPAKRVAVAMLPMVVVGAVIGIVLRDAGNGWREGLVLLWLMVYGCALHTAGMFALTRLKVLGWLCIAGAPVLLVYLNFHNASERESHLIMGFFFGVLHLMFGLIPARTAAKE